MGAAQMAVWRGSLGRQNNYEENKRKKKGTEKG